MKFLSLGIYLFVAAVILYASNCQRNNNNSIIGAWKLIFFEDIDSAGNKIYPFGDPPLGLFMYGESGDLSVQVAHNPPLSKWDPNKWKTASESEMQEMLRSTVSYFGTYTVKPEEGVLIHHIVSDLTRRYTGTDQLRKYHIANDTLFIEIGKNTRSLVRSGK